MTETTFDGTSTRLTLATVIEINPPMFLDVVLQTNNLNETFSDVTDNDGGSPDFLNTVTGGRDMLGVRSSLRCKA